MFGESESPQLPATFTRVHADGHIAETSLADDYAGASADRRLSFIFNSQAASDARLEELLEDERFVMLAGLYPNIGTTVLAHVIAVDATGEAEVQPKSWLIQAS